MTEREALKLVAQAIEEGWSFDRIDTEVYRVIQEVLAQPEQEPLAWPCVIAEADFSQNTVTLKMQGTDYKVSAGKHWLCTTPPQRTWVGPTDEEIKQASLKAGMQEHYMGFHSGFIRFAQAIEAKLKQKNGYDS